jgi:hypothetical protein
MRPVGPAWRELGPEGKHQQHPEALNQIDDEIEQLQARRIEPMGILGRHEQWLTDRESFQLGQQRLKCLRLLLFRSGFWQRIAGACWNRQMLRDQWDR